MRLFTINDDFDMMLIFYFASKQFRDDYGVFWIHIYDYGPCVALVSDDGKFSVQIDASASGEVRRYFFCEYLM
jgi:hypothetical protein